jgi:hypothetical protein
MSRGQRTALVLAAVVVAVIAFVAARPSGDDEEPTRSPPAPSPKEATRQTEKEPTTETQAAPEPRPALERISIAQGAVKGGPRTISVSRGEIVRVVVSSDAPDELHLHGFDITRNAGPGKPASFRFRARIEGSFEMESHTAEDAGRDPLVARVVVEPK